VRILLLVLALFGPLERLDWAVQRRVQGGRSPALEAPMHAASDLGRPPVVLSVLLGFAAFGGPAGVATARLAILTLVPTNLVVEGIKRGVGRTRPDGERKRANSSFPSSHAANAIAIAAVFSSRWRRLGPVFWLAALVVAGSRIYLNRHFLSDVLVGAAIGWLFAWLAAGWMDRVAAARTARES
jgi:undecaprenyl-diphosphatase